ncbi:MAG: molybdopterin-dependent oxidoreductase, partial [Sedimentisphaerales bacterium]
MSMEENIELDFSDISTDPNISRRSFLKTIGGGIVILFCIGDETLLEARRGGRSLPSDFNAFLRIDADGKVSCFTGKIEMGQGIITSMSTRIFGPPLRQAGAEARRVLIELAAEQLQVPSDRLSVDNGVVFDKNQKDKNVTYAALAKGNRITRRATGQVPVKDPSQFKVMGREFLHQDAMDKVTGKAKYTGDLRLPGMLYASILRPPSHGATLKSVDTSPAEQVEGATVVREGDLIAVLHKNPDQAHDALSRIKAEFDIPTSNVDDKTIFEHLLANSGNGNVVARGGDLQAGEKEAEDVVEQTYYDGYVAHAAMETHTALAQMEGDKITVWASTQSPFGIRDQVSRTLGIASENVHVITPPVGGGFGGKASGQQAIEAA